MRAWGDLVLQVVGAATAEVRLVAPYIKRDVFSRVLEAAPDRAEVKVYTRWRPDEVAAGVSDLEVFDIARARPRTSLLLCAPLHAKYYRADGRVLLGSANITGAALGWSSQPNFELLFETSWPSPALQYFEEDLARMSVAATDDMRTRVFAASQILGARPHPVSSEMATGSPTAFLPRTRNPELLFVAYSGSVEKLTTAARDQATGDLAALDLPLHLAEDQFNRYVGALMMQAPTIAALDDFVAQPRRFGDVRNVLCQLLEKQGCDRDASEAWQTVMRWLVYFLPDRYTLTVPGYSEIFCRVK